MSESPIENRTGAAPRAVRILPADLSSKIAAGEVIERPVSVVKELVENSLDSGALEITVESTGGGVESIRVVDNGGGIPDQEVDLAVERFATSKVSSADDLDAISTLGFRGEALPSIAAVSALSLVTRPTSADHGVRLDVTESETVLRRPQGAPPGTAVTVRKLFRNFPARRKFLRTEATEASRIQTLVTRYALAYPEVRFRLVANGSPVFESSGSGDLREVVAAVYSRDVAESMLDLSSLVDGSDADRPYIWGLAGPPSMYRSNRGHLSFFVNRRWVQDRMLGQAVAQAYHGFLMERRHPVAVINVTVPFDEIDVNVHPSKTEVRFTKSGQVFRAVQQTVRGALTGLSPVPLASGPAPAGVPMSVPSAPFWPTELTRPPRPAGESHRPGADAGLPGPAPLVPKKVLPVLRPLGQVQNTYIVAEGPGGMYLIDQHAAHERVLFERVRSEARSRASGSQTLLENVSVELDPRQREMFEAGRSGIEYLGFEVEHFGAQTYLLRRVPSLLSEGDPGQAFLEVLDLLAEGGDFETMEDRAAYSLACHGAIRAGKVMSREEIVELTRLLEDCDQPHSCPHGRPTMIHLSSAHMEREFGRR